MREASISEGIWILADNCDHTLVGFLDSSIYVLSSNQRATSGQNLETMKLAFGEFFVMLERAKESIADC